MSILDKANEFIGHPEEIDEGFEVSMRRDAYVQGYKDAIHDAYDWIKNSIDIQYEGKMTDEGPDVLDYINYAKSRLECATEVAETFRKYMEE